MTTNTAGQWMVVVDTTLPSPSPRPRNPVNFVGDDYHQGNDVEQHVVNNEVKGGYHQLGEMGSPS